MSARIIHGDCIEAMRELADDSIDAIVTDPPYGLGFMGKEWDALPPGLPWAHECLRVLKPGGHLLAFGGTRTWHRLAVAVEDAGFEIRDSIAWLYGSGFPKSLNVGAALMTKAGLKPSEDDWTPEALKHKGQGTALKPAFEPVVVGRKPFKGNVAANVLTHGTGALNIDACRIGTTDVLTGSGSPPLKYGGANHRPFHNDAEPRGVNQHAGGRWPANVVLDESQAAALDEQTGDLGAASTYTRTVGTDTSIYNPGHGGAPAGAVMQAYGDSGGASRFFKVAEEDELGAISTHFPREFDETFRYCAKAPKKERPVYVDADGKTQQHATVKPLALMRWLVRLVTPPGGVVLDPFAGSGTTVEAALIEGFDVIGIEREADYLPLIEARIARQKENAA